MNWPYLRRGDVAGILFMALVLAVLVLLLLFFPLRDRNFGFGPEWQCARMEQGDPICVRLVDKNAPDKGALNRDAPD
ncbi:hypothetical protein P9273_23835 [Mesorhizobium sp. WSM4935]|uniref:hypothetical protein n=1 Tax=Mesorhizobium sp. WSM4935 TaxID=3038547 RepID=UPI000502DE88|nr:hypothetical protein [Mesorhizobium sp. WSM4935]MDG4878110.1 hypothetical protein [Mesorhizobium sp. WSM4935]CDX41185.1 conserved hypothetical protein [Mesorhizobium sp. SOD10]